MDGEEEIEFLILPIEICRICTNLQSNLDILTDKLEDENVLLHEALEFVSCIRIDFNDGMSRTMCLTCCKKLSDAYKFKNQILDSYRAFYKQTSDVNFKREDLIYEEDSVIDDIDANSSKDSKLEDEPALVIERANELGIKLSTNAISFILEQNSCKTRSKIKQSPSQENLLADEEKATVIDAKPYKPPPLEENNKVQQVCRPYIKVETTPIEQTHQNAPSLKSKGPSIEDDQNNYIKSPPSAQTNKKAKETLNTRPLETNSTSLDNRRCRTTRSNSSLKSNLECHICHKILPKKSNLRDHMRLHANEKNFVCSYCEKAFVQVANYRMHLRVHTKERPYQCHLCPKTYSQGGSLKMHIRSHTKERNYVCEVCLRDFTNSSDLGKHKRIHDPSQHFACETCGRLFSQRINLKTHVKKVHSKAKQIKNNS